MENESVTIQAYHDAIKSTIEEAFSDKLKEVTYYTIKHGKIHTPSVSIELRDWQPSEDDDGTGMQSWDFSWSAYIFAKSTEKTAKIELRILSMELCQVINDNNFGLYASDAKISTCERDDFSPEWDAYEVFRIDWTQTAKTGVNIWDNKNKIAPEHVLTSISPETGNPYEKHYQEIE